MAAKVIAITGSNGKTTVKEMLARILTRARGEHLVLKTEGNFNNQIGVPLTLLRLAEQQRYAVIEMGANHRHEIEALLAIANPDIVFVNNARPAHVEGFGSLQGVIRAKGEMYESAWPDSLAVFNGDEDAVDYWRSIAASERRLSFSIRHDSDLTGGYRRHGEGLSIRVTDGVEDGRCNIEVTGEHNAYNALAAIALAVGAGLDLPEAAEALEGFAGVPGRQQIRSGLSGSRLIDDSYNANPDSLAVAMRVLRSYGGRSWMALGDMAELGPRAEEMHVQAIELAKASGIEKIFAYGEMSCRAARHFGEHGHCFESKQDMANFIAERLEPSVTLLIKGSRSAAMEDLLAMLSTDNPKGESHVV